ncbi:MAG: ATP-binding protein [Acidobacteriaceae bacterium]
MSAELYKVPTLALLAALVAVFGWLWLQGRSRPGGRLPIGQAPSARQRHLLWLIGWWLAALHLWMVLAGSGSAGAGRAIALVCMELAPLMFLASMAPQYLSKRARIPCVVAFGIPLVIVAAMVGVDPQPGVAGQAALVAFAVAMIAVGTVWSLRKDLLPVWVGMSMVAGFGSVCLWLIARGESTAMLFLVRSGMLLMAAMLFAAAFRRVTVGVFFTVGGLAVWALPGILQLVPGADPLLLDVTRLTNLLRLLTAMGMIVLVMEDEIATNHATHARDLQAQQEMQRYAALNMEAMPYESSQDEYDEACRAITEVSRFGQAAVFLRNAGGTFRLAGQAGLTAEQAAALDGVARQITDEKTQEISRPEKAGREIGHLITLDLRGLMRPEDEPVLDAFQKVRVLGIRVREGGWQGALLLGPPRHEEEPLQAQDLMPLELLVARIGAAREHALLLRRLMQSERLAGLGQLASSVAHELNNPLTAVTGFAELLAENPQAEVQERGGIILNEARRMKKIVESLVRFRRLTPAGRSPVSVELLLRDIEKLARHDLESMRVELELRIANDLPRAMGDGEQIRQVFLQLVRNASIALEELPEGEPRRLTVEVRRQANCVQTAFTDNGPGFPDPSRAFDPFLTTRHTGEGVGLGLSLCYSIVHEQGGEISAENVQPRGARVTVELPMEESAQAAQPRGDRDDDTLAPAM